MSVLILPLNGVAMWIPWTSCRQVCPEAQHLGDAAGLPHPIGMNRERARGSRLRRDDRPRAAHRGPRRATGPASADARVRLAPGLRRSEPGVPKALLRAARNVLPRAG